VLMEYERRAAIGPTPGTHNTNGECRAVVVVEVVGEGRRVNNCSCPRATRSSRVAARMRAEPAVRHQSRPRRDVAPTGEQTAPVGFPPGPLDHGVIVQGVARAPRGGRDDERRSGRASRGLFFAAAAPAQMAGARHQGRTAAQWLPKTKGGGCPARRANGCRGRRRVSSFAVPPDEGSDERWPAHRGFR